MAVKTTLAQLESVQAAIEAIEGGAVSYQWGDVRVTKQSLADLYKREKTLLVRYRREQGNKGKIRINLGRGIT